MLYAVTTFAAAPQVLLDKSTPHIAYRWIGLAALLLVYGVRVYFLQGCAHSTFPCWAADFKRRACCGATGHCGWCSGVAPQAVGSGVQRGLHLPAGLPCLHCAASRHSLSTAMQHCLLPPLQLLHRDVRPGHLHPQPAARIPQVGIAAAAPHPCSAAAAAPLQRWRGCSPQHCASCIPCSCSTAAQLAARNLLAAVLPELLIRVIARGFCCCCAVALRLLQLRPSCGRQLIAPWSRCSPQVNPELEGPTLPSKADEEFRPFVRRLPEFKFWCAAGFNYWLTFGCCFQVLACWSHVLPLGECGWPLLGWYMSAARRSRWRALLPSSAADGTELLLCLRLLPCRWSSAKAVMFGFSATFFPMFDVPVFW